MIFILFYIIFRGILKAAKILLKEQNFVTRILPIYAQFFSSIYKGAIVLKSSNWTNSFYQLFSEASYLKAAQILLKERRFATRTIIIFVWFCQITMGNTKTKSFNDFFCFPILSEAFFKRPNPTQRTKICRANTYSKFTLNFFRQITRRNTKIKSFNDFFLSIIFRGILKAAQILLKEQNRTSADQKFYFLASDGWGKQSQVVKGIEDFAVGAITVELESKKIPGRNTS